MAQPPDNPNFNEAARRHLDDAETLRKQERLANSDHLAGFAAECALKAILTGYLGGTLKNGKPFHPEHPERKYGSHVETLWSELRVLANGRTGRRFHAMVSQDNPFERWRVAERYSDGAHIDAERVDAHLAAANRTMHLHQQAMTDGALP